MKPITANAGSELQDGDNFMLRTHNAPSLVCRAQMTDYLTWLTRHNPNVEVMATPYRQISQPCSVVMHPMHLVWVMVPHVIAGLTGGVFWTEYAAIRLKEWQEIPYKAAQLLYPGYLVCLQSKYLCFSILFPCGRVAHLLREHSLFGSHFLRLSSTGNTL